MFLGKRRTMNSRRISFRGNLLVRFGIVGIVTLVVFTILGLQPTLAQRPPVVPPGGNPGNPPANPLRPIAPASPAPNQSDKHGIVASRGPNAPGRAGAAQFETIWRCTNCREELGRGEDKPNLTTCPKCGVQFDPNYAPKDLTNKSNSNSVPPIGLLGFACIGFLVAVVVIVVLFKWVLG
jgi:hypothetical protein